MSGAERFGVPGLDLTVPERQGQSGRTARAGLVTKCRTVPEEIETLLAVNDLIAFDAPLVGRSNHRTSADYVVLTHITAGSRRETEIGCDGLAELGNGQGS